MYCIGLLDFVFDTDDGEQQVLTRVQLKDERNAVFYDKLTYIYLQMPVFTKGEGELRSHFEKWLFLLKHLEDMDEIPGILNEPVFLAGFKLAEIAHYGEAELAAYEQSLKVYRDLKNVIDSAARKGWAEGLEEGMEKGLALALSRAMAGGMGEV